MEITYLALMPKVSRGGATKPSLCGGEGVARYLWCQQHVIGKDVLDIGCGYGYGSDLLAATAQSVIGADSDPRAVSIAKSRYRRHNLKFVLSNGISKLPSSSQDVAVAFEVIEHLADYRTLLFDVQRILRPWGEFIVSTPNLLYTQRFFKHGRPTNPYHLHEFFPAEIQSLLNHYFSKMEIYGQVCPEGALSRAEHLDALFAKKWFPQSMVFPLLRVARLTPPALKTIYLRWKGLPPLSYSEEGWRDYPIVPCDFFDDKMRVQIYRCLKKAD